MLLPNSPLQSPGMLGKAVRFRHCPATVSAACSDPVFGSGAGEKPIEPLRLTGLGKVARASQETGP